MDDVLIIYQATLLVIKNFLPAAIFVVFGLAYIYFTEKRDKHKKKKKVELVRMESEVIEDDRKNI